MRKIIIFPFFLHILVQVMPVFPAEMVDYSKLWQYFGEIGQFAYVRGYVDGSSSVWINIINEINVSEKQGVKIPENFYEHIIVKTATLYDKSKIADVITSLYKDPANSYIWFADMVIIARDSISGKDITNALLDARKRAISNAELNKKMKNK